VAPESAFDYVCREIERTTKLDAPVARGTARLAVKEAGLDPETVSAAQLKVVVQELLPRELQSLRIDGVEALCEQLAEALERDIFEDGADRAGSAASVLERLGS
jgi:hypothetical protein